MQLITELFLCNTLVIKKIFNIIILRNKNVNALYVDNLVFCDT